MMMYSLYYCMDQYSIVDYIIEMQR